MCMFDVDQDAREALEKSLLLLSFHFFLWDAKPRDLYAPLLKVILTILALVNS